MKNINSAAGVKEEVLKLIDGHKLKILDAGAGRGRIAQELQKKGHDVLIVDQENNLEYKLKFKKANLNEDLPFKNNVFDVVICTEVIDELENPRHLIREFKRIIVPNGYMVISAVNTTTLKGRLKFLIKGILYGYDEQDYIFSHHINPLSIIDFKRICKEEKLKLEKILFNNSKKELFGEIAIFKIRVPIKKTRS